MNFTSSVSLRHFTYNVVKSGKFNYNFIIFVVFPFKSVIYSVYVRWFNKKVLIKKFNKLLPAITRIYINSFFFDFPQNNPRKKNY